MKSFLLFLFFVSSAAFGDGAIIIREANRPASKFCLLGDTGIGTVMQKNIGQAMLAAGCLEIYVLGDIVYPSGIQSAEDPGLEEHFLKNYRPLMEKGMRFHLVMGNHDHMGKTAPWVEVAKKNDRVVFPHNFFAEVWGDVCIYAMDTVYLKNQGQSEWLDKTWNGLKSSCKFSIGIGHHPYLSVGLHGDAVGAVKNFHEEKTLGRVNLYISGHDHNFSDEGVVQGTRLLVNGSGGSEIRRMAKDPRVFAKSAHGFIALDFIESKGFLNAHYQFIQVKGTAATVIHENSVQGSAL